MTSQWNQIAALNRLALMGDWLCLKKFDSQQLLREIEPFQNSWVPYNPRKKINRFGLSVTSLDGGLSGIPDLDSISEYNKQHGTQLHNHSFNTLTEVYKNSPTLQNILSPYLPWLGRCHFLRLDAGGFFPPHYDINKTDFSYDEIRLIGFVNNCGQDLFCFNYDQKLKNNIQDGELYYFNANKTHNVFSFTDNSIQLVVTLKFDLELFKIIIENYIYK